MKILITGGTGFIGQKLIERLLAKGKYKISVLSRNKNTAQNKLPKDIQVYEWDPVSGSIDVQAFDNTFAIINLAGEPVAEGRWTKGKKDRIFNSRVLGTNLLIDSLKKINQKPKKFISASAIGIYEYLDDEEIKCEGSLGDDFLANVCKKWEEPVLNHEINELSSKVVRIGIVMGKQGGALKKMLPPFKAALGGKLGSGRQYMSWVHIVDLVDIFIYLLENETNHTIFNGVSPNPVTNSQFTSTLGKVLRRPTVFPVPEIILKLLFGEMSQILLGSQKIVPNHLAESGYIHKFPHLSEALENLLSKQ